MSSSFTYTQQFRFFFSFDELESLCLLVVRMFMVSCLKKLWSSGGVDQGIGNVLNENEGMEDGLLLQRCGVSEISSPAECLS